MESKLSRWCNGFLEAGWLATVILTPLFFNIHSDRVFEPDKIALLRTLAVFMLLIRLVKFIDGHEWTQLDRLKWSHKASIWKIPVVLPVALLVLLYILTTLTSLTPRVSWVGSYQRMQGTYSTLSYIIVFAVMLLTIRSRHQVRRLITTIIIVSLPVALYGILQRYNLDPLPWGGDTSRRIAGHMGNAIFIAAYLILTVPLTASRIIESFGNILTDKELSYADVIRSSIYIFILAVELLGIYWSFSRGPWLGLAVGMFAFVLIMLVSLRNSAPSTSSTNAATEKAKQDKTQSKFSILYPLLYLAGFLVALFVAAGFASNSVSTSLGLFGAIIGLLLLSIFILAASGIGHRWLWLSWMLLFAGLGLTLVLFNVPAETATELSDKPLVGNVFKMFNAWREVPGVGRAGRLLEDNKGTGRVRVLIWEGTLDLIRPHDPIEFPDGSHDKLNFLRPLLGYGPESMYVSFNYFYPPELALVESRRASPDRSHNETFDALAITGALGFIAWQALYLSVFYYSFKWLGVVRSKSQGQLLIGLWIGGALLALILFIKLKGAAYLGVAIPFGSIGGLVLYLIVYAITAKPTTPEQQKTALSATDRLLLTALTAALTAFYVEIHFGIAIAATRTHAFIFMALIVIIGAILPQQAAAPAPEVAIKSRARRRVKAAPTNRKNGTLISNAFILTLMLATFCFTYITFAPMPGEMDNLASIADLPSVSTIFTRSLLINPRDGFSDSPFLFGMMILSWFMGALLLISEAIKDGAIEAISARKQSTSESNDKIAATLFALMAVMGAIGGTLNLRSFSNSQRLGAGLMVVWALMCALSAVNLFFKRPDATLSAGLIAAMGVAFSLPILIAGGVWQGMLLLALSAVCLYFLWDGGVREAATAFLGVSVLSLFAGLSFGWLQASLIRASFIAPAAVANATEAVRRVAESVRFAGYLTWFYVFALFWIVIAAWGFAGLSLTSRSRQKTPAIAWGALAALSALGIFLMVTTNLRVIQADIIYKRGKPFDDQATRTQEPEAAIQLWDNSIGIYEKAISMAPNEDFYYLWLGRAYLEKAARLTSGQDSLLATAEQRLFDARTINPLNTDHTVNLARLHIRWAELFEEGERENHVKSSEIYYRAAIALSPQNSINRREYGSLVLSLANDCDRGLAIFQEAIDIDPFYAELRYAMADGLVICADQLDDDGARADYLAQAYAIAEASLTLPTGRDQEEEKITRGAAERFLNIGNGYLRYGFVEEARATTERAIELAPADLMPTAQGLMQSIETAAGTQSETPSE